jgi:diguanylate cyclase (GGDEF)-like protein
VDTNTLRLVLASIGIAAELAGAALLVVLFRVLRRHADRRAWFTIWGRAWLALAIGLAALAVRQAGFHLSSLAAPDEALQTRALYAAYQFAKLLFYSLLVIGVLMYARGVRHIRLARPLLYAAGIYTAVSVGMLVNLTAIVLVQAPAAVAAFAVCAVQLLRLPPSRRSLGARATAACFALLAALWVTYLVAFGLAESGRVVLPAPLALVLAGNSYLDLLLHTALGYGMVVLLLEERKREVDDAHAELAVSHDALRRAALYDALTGALNRRAFADGVGLELAGRTTGAVAVVDLDNLKQVNDRFGHGAGDELLCRVAEVLRLSLRAADKLYRWGGDEFLLLLPGARADEAQRRLQALLAAVPPVTLRSGAGVARIVVSVGAADYAGAEGIEAAIQSADQRMYAQKHQHRQSAGMVAAATA